VSRGCGFAARSSCLTMLLARSATFHFVWFLQVR
jgi:hypothetical protein